MSGQAKGLGSRLQLQNLLHKTDLLLNCPNVLVTFFNAIKLVLLKSTGTTAFRDAVDSVDELK